MKSISTIEHAVLRARLTLKAIRYAFTVEKNPFLIARKALLLWKPSRKIPYLAPRKKTFKKDGKYYWYLNFPAFPSPAFDQIFQKEIERKFGRETSMLIMAIVAMTKKCSLNCEHCFEWDVINQKEDLSYADLEAIVENLLSERVGQIIFSGGEPLNRYRDLICLLDNFKDRPVDCWINTSGHGLTPEKARQLKEAGLSGAIFSLDHYEPERHDQFRGRAGSFQEVAAGIASANEAGLICALSLCPTDEIASPIPFRQYMELARNLNAAFVQIMEPKNVGRNHLGAAKLSSGGVGFLEAAYEQNAMEGPLLSYPDYQKRTFGCMGGKRYVYIDTKGALHPCPFCKSAGTFSAKQSAFSTQMPEGAECAANPFMGAAVAP